jgi:hypothetical protein
MSTGNMKFTYDADGNRLKMVNFIDTTVYFFGGGGQSDWVYAGCGGIGEPNERLNDRIHV